MILTSKQNAFFKDHGNCKVYKCLEIWTHYHAKTEKVLLYYFMGCLKYSDGMENITNNVFYTVYTVCLFSVQNYDISLSL